MAQCKNCGNYTEAPDGLCDNCRSQQAAFADAQTAAQQPSAFADNVVISDDYGKVMDGFKGGLLSAIFGVISSGLAGGAAGAIAALLVEEGGFWGGLIAFIVCFVIALPFMIIALVKGINAIKFFAKRCKENKAKPIPGFCCGIVGVANVAIAALSFLSALLSLFAALAG